MPWKRPSVLGGHTMVCGQVGCTREHLIRVSPRTVSLEHNDAPIVDPTQLVAVTSQVESSKALSYALGLTEGRHIITNTQAFAIVTTPSSDGWRKAVRT
jgi:hypothetical protein